MEDNNNTSENIIENGNDNTTQEKIIKPKNNELRQRVIYSFIMMGGGLSATILGGVLWSIAAGFVMAVIAFEWANIAGASKKSRNVAAIVSLLAGFMFVNSSSSVEVMACVVYLTTLVLVSLNGGIIAVVASAYFALCGFAFASLRMTDDGMGMLYIFGLFSVVWATDSSAYAIGRTLKGPKLLPSVSPNKTWSGFLGGLVAGIAAGALYSVLANIILNPNDLFKTIGIWSVVGLILSLASQGGDLIESLLKRHFGVKDASKLIPGHGGLLDRLDGHLAVALVLSIIVAIPNFAALLR